MKDNKNNMISINKNDMNKILKFIENICYDNNINDIINIDYNDTNFNLNDTLNTIDYINNNVTEIIIHDLFLLDM